jgi:hypothetical protein
MAFMHSLRVLLTASALCVTGMAVAQATEQSKSTTPAEKAAATKKANATTKPAANKRLDFAPSTPVTGSATQSLSPTATQVPSGTLKEQSHCHHGGSDA